MSDSAESPKPSTPKSNASTNSGDQSSAGGSKDGRPNRNRRRSRGPAKGNGPKSNERDARRNKSGGQDGQKDGESGDSNNRNRSRNRNRNRNKNASGNREGGPKRGERSKGSAPKKKGNSSAPKGNKPARRPKQAATEKVGIIDRILIALGLKKISSPAPKTARQKEIRRQTQQAAARHEKVESGEIKETPKVPAEQKTSRLYIGNLSYDVTEQDLQELFKGVGKVRQVDIIYNGQTHRSKGFGFIKMNTIDEAEQAIEILNEQFFMGRKMQIKPAEKNQQADANRAETEASQSA